MWSPGSFHFRVKLLASASGMGLGGICAWKRRGRGAGAGPTNRAQRSMCRNAVACVHCCAQLGARGRACTAFQNMHI